jgi:hypothetical protein
VLGTAPTTCWVPGEVIADPYQIDVGTDIAPGGYTLETGFYLLETGQRLPTSGPASAPEGRIILTTVQIVNQ